MARQNIIKGTDIHQRLLLPIDMTEWLSDDDVVYAIIETLPLLDLSDFYAEYRKDGIGGSFYDPISMLGILMYALVRGERTSRKIELACRFDVGYRIAGQNIQPDHTTIFRFRQRFVPQLKDIFRQFSELLVRSGVTSLGIIALDGTKMGANVSLSANRNAKWLSRKLADAMVEEFEEGLLEDAQNEDGDQSQFPDFRLPEELSTRERRLKRLNAANDALIEEQNEKAKRKEEELAEREDEERESGKKKRGRKPNPPCYDVPSDAKVNLTDPESRIMKTRNGHIQGYNVQFVTDIHQFILAAEVTNDQNDMYQLEPLVNEITDLARDCEVEPHSVLVADAGYYSTSNILSENKEGPKLLIATKKERDFKEDFSNSRVLSEVDEFCRPDSDQFPAIPVIASLARVTWESFQDRDVPAEQTEVVRCIMNARMDIPTNREQYRKRKWMVESVNGNLKSNWRFTRFQGKGLKFCAGELALVALTMNVLKARNLNVLDRIHKCQKRQENVKTQRGKKRLSVSKDMAHGATGIHDAIGIHDGLFRWLSGEFHSTEGFVRAVV